jgi:hypothetical protein
MCAAATFWDWALVESRGKMRHILLGTKMSLKSDHVNKDRAQSASGESQKLATSHNSPARKNSIGCRNNEKELCRILQVKREHFDSDA